ncbi:hypothetical protein TNCV_5001821 [Trichonephila clavipes]|nr:hypothetical protein TNCV_5001821 [Trichonephila clavipes]
MDSRFGRCGDMTSIANWSERTDSTNPSTTTTGLGASPSRVTTGDELIAEKSDLFRKRSALETFTRLGPLDVPLFRIPASEKELDKILLRLKNKPVDPPAVKNQEAKKAAVPHSTPASPRKGKKAGKRSVDSDGFAPPKQLVRKARSPRLSPPPSPTPPSATSVEVRVWKARRRKWILRNRLSCKIRSWCPR